VNGIEIQHKSTSGSLLGAREVRRREWYQNGRLGGVGVLMHKRVTYCLKHLMLVCSREGR
jgi:hypothetical protein